MLWCWPNDNLLKITNFVKVIECGNSSFGLDQVLIQEHDKKAQAQNNPFYGANGTVLSKIDTTLERNGGYR